MKPILRFAGGLLSAALVCAAVPAAFGDVALKLREGPPGLSRYEAPLFPEYAKHRGIAKGSVLLAVAWRADGTPADVVILSSSFPSFGEAAQDAAWHWRRAAREPAVQTYGLSFELNGVIVVASKMLTDYAAEVRAERAPRAVQAEELDAELRALEQPMPTVSVAVSSRHETGRVVVEFFVDEAGRVRAPTIVHATADEFAEAALAAMSRWRYETPRRHGQPVVASMRWAFDFKRTS
jgi:TonB family protein